SFLLLLPLFIRLVDLCIRDRPGISNDGACVGQSCCRAVETVTFAVFLLRLAQRVGLILAAGLNLHNGRSALKAVTITLSLLLELTKTIVEPVFLRNSMVSGLFGNLTKLFWAVSRVPCADVGRQR